MSLERCFRIDKASSAGVSARKILANLLFVLVFHFLPYPLSIQSIVKFPDRFFVHFYVNYAITFAVMRPMLFRAIITWQTCRKTLIFR